MIKIPKQRYFGHVYEATNTSNGKVYVGQTRRDRWGENKKPVNERWKEHLKEAERYGKDPSSSQNSGSRYLNHAIQKYGPDVWEVKRIDTAYSLSELNEKEKYWVKKYDSTIPEKGYNLREGGDGTLVNPESIDKLREANKRQFSDPQNVEKHSELTKDMWKQQGYRNLQEKARNTPEFKEKMRSAREKDWNNPEYRKNMEKIRKSDEYINKQRESQEKRWNKPGAKEAQSKRAENQWNTPEINEKHLKTRSDPEYKKKQSEAMKENRNAYKAMENKKEFLNDIKNKMPLKELTEKYGISYPTVNERIKEYLGDYGVRNSTGAREYLKDKEVEDVLKDIDKRNTEKQDENQTSEMTPEDPEEQLKKEQDEEVEKTKESLENDDKESIKEVPENDTEEKAEKSTDEENEVKNEKGLEEKGEESQISSEAKKNESVGDDVPDGSQKGMEGYADLTDVMGPVPTQEDNISTWIEDGTLKDMEQTVQNPYEDDSLVEEVKDYDSIDNYSSEGSTDYEGIDEFYDDENSEFEGLGEESVDEGNDFDGIDEPSDEGGKDYDNVDEGYSGGGESGGRA